MKKRLVGLMMAIQCLSCVIAAAAFAQKIPIFNANVYESIASPNAPDIPPGTAITRDNWTKYAPYMTIGMQETLWGKALLPYTARCIVVGGSNDVYTPALEIRSRHGTLWRSGETGYPFYRWR